MKKLLMALAALTLFAAPATAMEKEIGQTAPGFTAKDITGKDITLSSYKGKIVVLEWTNHLCPFVKKHYETKNMQTLQKEMADKGVVWISVVSSAPEKQGHTTPEEAAQILKDQGATVTAKILDEEGKIGHLYGAQTTPHMFVIDAEGKLAYIGAIDSDKSPNHEAVKTAKNYVRQAVGELMDGKPVSVSTTQSYGCGVKY